MLIADATTQTMQAAMAGLSRRLDVRAHNVSNSATPTFRAQQVEFEQLLADAVRAGGDPRAVRPTVSAAPNLPDGQGNTVDLATDMVGMLKDNLAYDTAVHAFNHKTGLLSMALRG